MRFLQIHTFYHDYLQEFFGNNRNLAQASYDTQIAALLNDGFSGCHLIAPYISNYGYEAHLVIANCMSTQLQWLHEHNININTDTFNKKIIYTIARKQIETLRPEILYVSNPILFDNAFIRTLEWTPLLVIGWWSISLLEEVDWSSYDILLSNSNTCLQKATALGAAASEFFSPGFPTFIAEKVQDEPKLCDIVFCGRCAAIHTMRREFLSAVVDASSQAQHPFDVRYHIPVSSSTSIPASIMPFNHQSCWGLDMYRILRSSRIALNIHMDFSCDDAGNMRMFEATGVGSFLLTNYQSSIEKYFVPGVEVETFNDKQELIEKIHYYLTHPREREAIAERGQQRCLQDHSMEKRAQEFQAIIKKYLRAFQLSSL